MEKRYESVDRIIECGIYLYMFLMFLAKGEGLRNGVIFGGFVLWLLTIKQRKNLHLLKEPAAVFCWIYLSVTLVTAFFSIDPLFSLRELKGAPMKFGLLFPVIATVMTDEKRLKNAIHVSFMALIFIVAAGYYSYTSHDMELLKPDTILVHAWHNRFARYLCILIPISFILHYVWKEVSLKIALAFTLLLSVIALILSTSRGGFAAFISIIATWSLYLSKTKGYNFKKFALSLITIFIIIGVFSYLYFPDVKTRVSRTSEDVFTLNERTEIWRSAIYAIMKKPVSGWGYGDRIFHQEDPYEETPYKKPPVKGPHNSFLKVLFHQGVVALVPYSLIILTAIAAFWKEALGAKGVKSYMLAACVSILIGNYIIHAMLAEAEFMHLAVVLGLGMAAKGIREDSYN